MPPGFDVHDQHVRLWAPLLLDPAQRTQNRGSHFLYLVGRIKPGVDAAAGAQRAANAARAVAGRRTVRRRIRSLVNAGSCTRRRTKTTDCASTISRPTWSAACERRSGFCRRRSRSCCSSPARTWRTSCSCAPSRATRRSRCARRSARDASRLLRQFIAEGLVLSVDRRHLSDLGSAWAGLRVLVSSNAGSIPRSTTVHLDAVVLAFTLIIAVGTGVLFGLAPLLHLSAHSVGSRAARRRQSHHGDDDAQSCAARTWRSPRWRWR